MFSEEHHSLMELARLFRSAFMLPFLAIAVAPRLSISHVTALPLSCFLKALRPSSMILSSLQVELVALSCSDQDLMQMELTEVFSGARN